MKIHLKTIIQISFLFWISNVFGQSLSYQDAREIMIQNNKKLKSLDMQLKSADYVRKQSLSYRMPQIKVTGLATHLSDDVTMDLGDLGTALTSLATLGQYSSSTAASVATASGASTAAAYYNQYASGYGQVLEGLNATDWEHYKIQDQNMLTVDANLMYPLFTGGKINAAIKVGKIKKKITEMEVTKEQNSLITELSTRYFQLQLASEVVAVRKQALEATEQHLENAQKLEKNGMGASVETMQAETAVADAKRELLSAEKDRILAQTALEGTLGVDTISTDLTTPLFISDKLQELPFYIDEAQKYYPDINKLFLVQEMVHQGVKAKRAGYIPDVALTGSYHIFDENLASSVAIPDYFIGVGVSFSIFEGLKHRNEVQEMKAKEESVTYMKEQALEDIGILVRKFFQELDKHRALVSSLDKDQGFAEELLRVREKAFNEGMGTSVDVVDATLYLSSIRLKRLKALYDYDISLASLLEVCGKSTDFNTYMGQ